jgi:hypothetical protein
MPDRAFGVKYEGPHIRVDHDTDSFMTKLFDATVSSTCAYVNPRSTTPRGRTRPTKQEKHR